MIKRNFNKIFLKYHCFLIINFLKYIFKEAFSMYITRTNFFDFFYMAETRNELKIRGVKEELEKYGLVFIVDYQARKNNLNNSGSR
jgi:hypothetical protein